MFFRGAPATGPTRQPAAAREGSQSTARRAREISKVFEERFFGCAQNDQDRLMGPDFVGVGLIGVDVDHPAEDLLDPAAVGLGAGVLGGDGAGEAEFFPVSLRRGRTFGRHAEIHVFVPARHGERDAVVELLLGGVFRCGEHGADQLVAVLRSFYKAATWDARD